MLDLNSDKIFLFLFIVDLKNPSTYRIYAKITCHAAIGDTIIEVGYVSTGPCYKTLKKTSKVLFYFRLWIANV